MTTDRPAPPAERLFPFVLRSRILLVGRDTVRRRRGRLHFVLVTTDLSESSLREVVEDFSSYPVIQCYTSAQLEAFFNVRGAKVVGFTKSGLSQSIYAELKLHRIHQPPALSKPPGSPPAPPTVNTGRRGRASRPPGRR